jgi:sec-independent protein translocase protein TatB
MLNFSPERLFLVGLIAMVVLGPSRLPQAARTLGRLVAELRRMSSSFHDEVRGALSEPTEMFNSALGDFRPPTNIRHSIRDAITTTLTPAPPAAPPAPSASAPQETGGLPGAPDDPSLN